MNKTHVWMIMEAGAFAENKDVAARIRENLLKPNLQNKISTRLDFSTVNGTTQSFIHALISEPLRQNEDALDLIEFHACNAIVRSIIEIVVNYSQWEPPGSPTARKKKQ